MLLLLDFFTRARAPKIDPVVGAHARGGRPDCRSHSSSLAVEHRSYEPGVAGSIPAWSISSACSVMVIIGASQALDPGSIPGKRKSGSF